MLPWHQLGSATTPEGAALRLMRRGRGAVCWRTMRTYPSMNRLHKDRRSVPDRSPSVERNPRPDMVAHYEGASERMLSVVPR